MYLLITFSLLYSVFWKQVSEFIWWIPWHNLCVFLAIFFNNVDGLTVRGNPFSNCITQFCCVDRFASSTLHKCGSSTTASCTNGTTTIGNTTTNMFGIWIIFLNCCTLTEQDSWQKTCHAVGYRLSCHSFCLLSVLVASYWQHPWCCVGLRVKCGSILITC